LTSCAANWSTPERKMWRG